MFILQLSRPSGQAKTFNTLTRYAKENNLPIFDIEMGDGMDGKPCVGFGCETEADVRVTVHRLLGAGFGMPKIYQLA